MTRVEITPDARALEVFLAALGWDSHTIAFWRSTATGLTDVIDVYATHGDVRLVAEWVRPTGTAQWAMDATAAVRGQCHHPADFRSAHPIDHHDAFAHLADLDQLRVLAGLDEGAACGAVMQMATPTQAGGAA